MNLVQRRLGICRINQVRRVAGDAGVQRGKAGRRGVLEIRSADVGERSSGEWCSVAGDFGRKSAGIQKVDKGFRIQGGERKSRVGVRMADRGVVRINSEMNNSGRGNSGESMGAGVFSRVRNSGQRRGVADGAGGR